MMNVERLAPSLLQNDFMMRSRYAMLISARLLASYHGFLLS